MGQLWDAQTSWTVAVDGQDSGSHLTSKYSHHTLCIQVTNLGYKNVGTFDVSKILTFSYKILLTLFSPKI